MSRSNTGSRPSAPVPAAPDDCEAAARWIASSPQELGRVATGLVITGDSAGGNLAIVTTKALVNDPAAAPGLVRAPICPVADEVSQHRSFSYFFEGFLLTGPTMAWFTRQYGGDPGGPAPRADGRRLLEPRRPSFALPASIP